MEASFLLEWTHFLFLLTDTPSFSLPGEYYLPDLCSHHTCPFLTLTLPVLPAGRTLSSEGILAPPEGGYRKLWYPLSSPPGTSLLPGGFSPLHVLLHLSYAPSPTSEPGGILTITRHETLVSMKHFFSLKRLLFKFFPLLVIVL